MRWAAMPTCRRSARTLGGVFLRLPEGLASDSDLFEDYLSIIKEMGELSKRFIAAKEDGDIDRPEFQRV